MNYKYIFFLWFKNINFNDLNSKSLILIILKLEISFKESLVWTMNNEYVFSLSNS